MNQNELYHYGVLGMKWGISRARRTAAKLNYKNAKKSASSYSDLKKAKLAYKKEKKSKANDVNIANKLYSKGSSIVKGVLANSGNTLIGGLPSVVDYFDNRSASKRNKE